MGQCDEQMSLFICKAERSVSQAALLLPSNVPQLHLPDNPAQTDLSFVLVRSFSTSASLPRGEPVWQHLAGFLCPLDTRTRPKPAGKLLHSNDLSVLKHLNHIFTIDQNSTQPCSSLRAIYRGRVRDVQQLFSVVIQQLPGTPGRARPRESDFEAPA